MIKNLLMSGLSVGLVRLIGAILGFLITIVLSRFLGPAGLGKFALISTILMIVAVPVTQAFGTMVLRETSTARIKENWGEVRGLVKSGLFVGLAICLLFALIGAPLVNFQFASMVILLLAAIILFFDQASALRASTLRGLDRPVLAFGPEMIVRPGIFIVFLLLWFLAFGKPTLQIVLGLLAIAVIINYIAGSWLLSRVRPDRLISDPANYRPAKWTSAAVPLTAGSGLMLVFVQVDILMLGWLAEPETLGIYRVGFQIALLSGLAYVALNLIAGERFATHFAAQDTVALNKSAKTIARAALICALPIPILMLVIGKQIITVLFGAEYQTAYTVVLILSLSHMLNAAFGMARTMLVMSGHEKLVFWWTIPALLLNLVLCLILIPVFGGLGAAISVLLSSIVWNAQLWWTSKNRLLVDSSIF